MKRHLVYGAFAALTFAACGKVDPQLVIRPEGTTPFQADRAELVTEGEALWKDPNLGKAGVACQSCHVNGAQFKDSFKQPYPHRVGMARSKSGLESIDAEQMVQFCMVVPMKSEPLAWDSRELAALTAYVEDVEQKNFASR